MNQFSLSSRIYYSISRGLSINYYIGGIARFGWKTYRVFQNKILRDYYNETI